LPIGLFIPSKGLLITPFPSLQRRATFTDPNSRVVHVNQGRALPDHAPMLVSTEQIIG
jgi:hypothetical protein